jgi:glycosyltransferase involved in cell wall biosynthesis
MVVEGYRGHASFRRAPVHFVATHWERGPWMKAAIAIGGWLRVAWKLVMLDRPLVHVHVSSRASFWRKSMVCLMARVAGRPYLLHVHGGEFHRFYGEECGPFAQWFIRRIFARAALVLALTEGWRTRLAAICPQAAIEVLRNGVALPSRASRKEAPRVLFLSLLHRAKGTHDLVHAFARLTARFPQWTLMCAGNGAIEEIRALAEELGIEDKVTCPGWLDARAKDTELAAAAIFVLPSYAEGLPMALLEAMAWGIPVIATPVGGIPGAIQHGQNGILISPGDVDALSGALGELMHSGERRRALGNAARSTIEQEFSLDASVAHLLHIYSRFGISAT